MKLVTEKDFDKHLHQLAHEGAIYNCPCCLKKDDPALYRQEFEYWKDGLIRDREAVQKDLRIYWRKK